MGSPRVLVVDDDRDLCDLLADFLVEEGYLVTTAYAGQEAIDAARLATPDAVLLDLLLPDISGVQVGRALREIPGARNLPSSSSAAIALPSRAARPSSGRTRSSRSRSA